MHAMSKAISMHYLKPNTDASGRNENIYENTNIPGSDFPVWKLQCLTAFTFSFPSKLAKQVISKPSKPGDFAKRILTSVRLMRSFCEIDVVDCLCST